MVASYIPVQQRAPTRFSEDHYLALDAVPSDVRYEYRAGEIRALAQTSVEHARISSNIQDALSGCLRGKQCISYTSGLRISVPLTDFYFLPDIAIVCGKPQLHQKATNTVVNPSAIIEILSDSTEGFDKGEKFEQYRRMQSVQLYLIVHQKERRVELYRRTEGGWLLTEAPITTGELDILGCPLPLDRIYDGISFDSDSTEAV